MCAIIFIFTAKIAPIIEKNGYTLLYIIIEVYQNKYFYKDEK